MAFDGIDFTGYRRAFRNYAGLARLMRDAKAQQKTVIFIYHVDSNGFQGSRDYSGSGWQLEHTRLVTPPMSHDNLETFTRFEAADRIPRRIVTMINPGVNRGHVPYSAESDNNLVNLEPSNVSDSSGSVFGTLSFDAYANTNGRGMINVPDPDASNAYSESIRHVVHTGDWLMGLHIDGTTWQPQIGYIQFGTSYRPRDYTNAFPDDWGYVSPTIMQTGSPWNQWMLVSGVKNTGVTGAAVNANRLYSSPEGIGTSNVLVNQDLPPMNTDFETTRGIHFQLVASNGSAELVKGPFIIQYLDFVQTHNSTGNPVTGGLGCFYAHSQGGVANRYLVERVERIESNITWQVKRLYEKMTALGDDVVFVPMILLRGLNVPPDSKVKDAASIGPFKAEERYYGSENERALASEFIHLFSIWQDIFNQAGVPQSARHIHFSGAHPVRVITDDARAYLSPRELSTATFHELFHKGVLGGSGYSFCDMFRLLVPDGQNNELAEVDQGIPDADGYTNASDQVHLDYHGYFRMMRNWWGSLLDEANGLGSDDPQFNGHDIFSDDDVGRLSQYLGSAPTGAGRLGSRIWA